MESGLDQNLILPTTTISFKKMILLNFSDQQIIARKLGLPPQRGAHQGQHLYQCLPSSTEQVIGHPDHF
jgi:hypothetical protein